MVFYHCVYPSQLLRQIFYVRTCHRYLHDAGRRGDGETYSDHPLAGFWAGDKVAVLRRSTTPEDLPAADWGDALRFGLHKFADVGAGVRDMLLEGGTFL